MVLCCCTTISHLLSLGPVRKGLRYCAAVLLVVVVVFIWMTETRRPDDTLMDKLKHRVNSFAVPISSSDSTASAFCDGGKGHDEAVTLQVQLQSEAQLAVEASRLERRHREGKHGRSAGMIHNKVPRPATFCRISRNDDEQIARCRQEQAGDEGNERRRARSAMLGGMTCRSAASSSSQRLSSAVSARCRAGGRTENKHWPLYLKCMMMVVADELGLRPGMTVLEYGSADASCGHSLTMLKQLFDVDGVGTGFDEAAVQWAQKHAAGRFCLGAPPASPSLRFDGVFALDAVARLPTARLRCNMLRHAVSVLRSGSRGLFGGFGGPHDAAPANTTWISWMSKCGIASADFRAQVDASVRMGHHPHPAHDDDGASSPFAPSQTLQVASFRPVRELGVYPGTEHSLWVDVLLGNREGAPRFEGSSYAVVIEK